MSVDISEILHVLAHELRTPVGIAHGYVRLLLEDRLPQHADRRRALEQMQKALGRLSDLSQESSRLASWFEHDPATTATISAKSLFARLEEVDFEYAVSIDANGISDDAAVRTPDAAMLTAAMASIIHATARELRGDDCAVVARMGVPRSLDVLVGPPDHLDALAAGPTSAAAGPLGLERGGLGLSLVHAAIVLDAHGAQRWTINQSRQTAGFRLPLVERSET
jgi:signal transduction histidine kinase